MSHEHRQHPERFYDDEGEAYDDPEGMIWEPGAWFDRPGKPAPGDEAQPWEYPNGPEGSEPFHGDRFQR